jgi:hypothetical protein
MATILEMKNPKEILNKLASKPMTKWELKQAANIVYTRVSESISLLEKHGYAITLDTLTSKRGKDMKLYGLTFKGVVAYLSSISTLHENESENNTESENNETNKIIHDPSSIRPLQKYETIEAYKERKEKEEEKCSKEFEKITVFLETYGKILHYPLFSEIRWLKEKYGHNIFNSLIGEAKIVNDMQPFPSSVMLLVKNTQKKVNDLRNLRWAHLREPEHKIDKKNAELEDITERLKDAEEMLKILRAQENKWWSMGFAARFADEFCQDRGNGNMRNEILQGFFAQVAEYYRRLEVESAEKMTQIFSEANT